MDQFEHRRGGVERKASGVQGLTPEQTEAVNMSEMSVGQQHRSHLGMLPDGKLFAEGSGGLEQMPSAVFINGAQRHRVTNIGRC